MSFEEFFVDYTPQLKNAEAEDHARDSRRTSASPQDSPGNHGCILKTVLSRAPPKVPPDQQRTNESP